MSTMIPILGGLMPKILPVRLTTTGRTDIFTPNVGTGNTRNTVVCVTCSNETAGAVNILIEYFDGVSNYYLFRRPVPANDTVFFSDHPVVLLKTHKITATAGSANAITVALAVMQDSGASGGG